MSRDQSCKELAVEHCRRINARDIAGLLSLYAPTVRFEDPIGSGVRTGHAELRRHALGALHCDVHEYAHDPVGVLDGTRAALPVTAHLDFGTAAPLLSSQGFMDWDGTPAGPGRRLQIHYVMVIETDATGLVRAMRAYWGRTDVTVVDEHDVLTMPASR
ncbi:nuclear transport factor 2 family protein [Actinomadura sp. WMMB 499]|uniref:nuclear transport factor 2 family protein n=1 Tax=Actinomadura sp. WMMB 499 TaxID=1219491 RepID=UPI001246BD7B|nr:nuclear transport factor 2 family protein [Actinomadura sp. WMMB 499]QFG20257.1 nuclear transport factor 2 [Actinomadura sp. WMMB 499]